MTFPSSFDSLPAPVDGVSEVVAADILDLAAAIDHTQQAVGLESDPPSSSGSVYARIASLVGSSGGISKQTTAPSSPSTDDLWLDTDDPNRPLTDFYAAAWHLIGANALKLQGRDIATTAPTDAQVLAWNNATQAWTPAAASGGMTNPMTAEGDLIHGGTVSGGIAPPTRLGIGSVGQYLGVLAGPTLSWITPAFMSAPSGAVEGSVPLYTGGSWTAQGPGSTSGYAWTSNGPGAVPTWQAIPVSPPGSGLAVPTGPRVGALLSWDDTGSPYWLLPGAAGTVLTAHGDNNVAGSKLTWVTPSSGGASIPFTTTGDILYSSDNSGTPARLAISATNAANKFLGISGGAPAWKPLDGIVVGTYLDFAYGSAPGTPAASTGRIYAKTSTGLLYFKNAVGTEYDLTGGGGGSSFYQTVRNALNTADMTQRGKLRFTGTALNSITDDSGNDATIINYDTPAVFGASGSGHTTGVVPDPGSSAGSTRFLREDATWAVPSGGGGGSGGSRLSRTTNGLILWHDYSLVPDHALTTTADAWGYQVRTTFDHGTWAFRNGLLINTTSDNPGDCSNFSISQQYAVYQTRFYTASVGSTQAGPEWTVQSGADTRMAFLVRNGDASVFQRSAGSWGSSFGSGAPSGMIQGQWICSKIKWGSTLASTAWVNRTAMFTNSTVTGVGGAGGFGLISVSAANTVFKDYAIYASTILTVAGLTSTQAFRLLDAGGNVVATSAAQSGGTATVDLGAVCDCPFAGSIEVHSSTAFTSLITGGRFPAEGVAADIWGGSTYTYV